MSIVDWLFIWLIVTVLFIVCSRIFHLIYKDLTIADKGQQNLFQSWAIWRLLVWILSRERFLLFTSNVLLNCSFVVIPSCHIVILLIIRLHIYPRKIKFYKLCHKIRIRVEQYPNSIKQIEDDLLTSQSMISRRGSRSFCKGMHI